MRVGSTPNLVSSGPCVATRGECSGLDLECPLIVRVRVLPLAQFSHLRYNALHRGPIGLWASEGGAVSSRQLGVLAVVVAILSWAGLGYVIATQPPTALTAGLVFPLLFLAVGSVATLPLSWLRRRLVQEAEATVVLREGGLAGLYVTLIAGLQLARMLDAIVGLVLAAIFVLFEAFLLQRPESVYRTWLRRTTRSRDSRRKKQSKKR